MILRLIQISPISMCCKVVLVLFESKKNCSHLCLGAKRSLQIILAMTAFVAFHILEYYCSLIGVTTRSSSTYIFKGRRLLFPEVIIIVTLHLEGGILVMIVD